MVLLKKLIDGVFGIETPRDGFKKKVLEYGYVILNFDFPKFREIQSRIFPATLYEGGLAIEETAHIMFQYGIKDVVSAREMEKCLKVVGLSECKAFNMSVLHIGEYDVLKFDVKGEMIERMSKEIWKLRGTSIMPKFNDCLRVAKLKPDAGGKIVELYNQEEYVLTPKYAVYCDVYMDKHLVWSF